jgi:hypothetical protein
LLGPVGSDGAFRIAPVQPGRYTVRVDGKPEDAYIKAIALNGAPVAEGTLDFSGGVRGPAVKITLSLNGAQVSGEVRNADASPLLTPNNVFVSLAPQPGQTAPVRIGTPVVDGHYVFKGVPPGKYRIYATDIMRLGPGRIDAAQQELAAAAETVEVKEGDRIAKDLKAVLPEAPHANPQR